MNCAQTTSQTADPQSGGGGDRLDGGAISRPFDHSATAWLVGQAVRALNSADKEGELAYRRTAELLRRCDDVMETIKGLSRATPAGDAPLRWCLLYVLGDAGDAKAGEFLVRAALDKLPERNPDEGCEGQRDCELLVRTMAIHAVGKIAERHREAAEYVVRLVAERPDRVLLIEAVKVGVELGLAGKLREMLPKEDQWILDIKRARTEEVFAEPEREDGKERGFTPPKRGALYTAPHGGCCSCKEG